ncbi:MAG: hypothetical protein WAO98_08095 [Alphaproteobacteria bacterium]
MRIFLVVALLLMSLPAFAHNGSHEGMPENMPGMEKAMPGMEMS